VERERIEELRLLALERRIDADLASGRSDLVPELESLVASHPYRERFRGQLMLALYHSGRQADALEAFRTARTALVDDLGVEPSPELQELHAAILRQDPSLAPSAPSPAGGQTRLPDPPNALIGRELELAAITALVREGARILTLTGTGGTGKTRLALEAAHELAGDFPGGVHFVDLAPLPEARLVAATAARALGLHDADDEVLVERMAAAIGGRTLLVLDNFEHLLKAAPLVAELAARAPELQVLATSREPLRIRVEREYRVAPLALPELADAEEPASLVSNDAVALFLERARDARPDLALTAENAASVAGICRALDGLPLALELAAARVRLLSPPALLERLSDRLAVLADGDRDLPDRQRTLRATMDWSYELLDPSEAELLARLAVFAGGWTLEAAEIVANADLSALGSLADKNLVRADTLRGGETRFSMLETVREYALERLSRSGEADELRDSHATYFAELAERLEPELYSTTAFDEAERDHDNFRAALTHTRSTGQTELLLRLTAIARFWYVRGYLREGREWLEPALGYGGADRGRRATALSWAAGLDWTLGDHDAAIATATESLELAREIGDELGTLRALTILGLAHNSLGNHETSRRFHTESLDHARELERPRDICVALANLSDLAFHRGDHAEARRLATESLEIGRRIEDEHTIGGAQLTLAVCSLDEGNAEAARPLILDSVRALHSLRFPDYLASALVALARANEEIDPSLAARLIGAARTIRAPLGPPAWQWEPDWSERTLRHLAERLGDSAAAAQVEAGARDPAAVVAEIVRY
jgi:predicted ATPase